jgi:hypothetical protein
MIKQTNDKAAVVDTGVHWLPIDKDTPRGTKLQLINRRYGVAQYGMLTTGDTWYTHWAPLPTFKK